MDHLGYEEYLSASLEVAMGEILDGEAGAHRGSDRQAFAQGYSNRLKSRRGGAALKGGAVGIGAGLVGLYLLVSAVCVGRGC